MRIGPPDRVDRCRRLLRPRRTGFARRLAAGSIAALALLAAACTLQPRYERPAAPVPAQFPGGEAYRAGTAPGVGVPAPDIGWRDFLGDPRLQKLVEIALANNRDLRVAALNVAAVRALYQVERAALFPQLNGVATATHSRTPASVSLTGHSLVVAGYSVGLSAAWEIDFFGRLQSLKDVALDQYLATAQARKSGEMALVAQVADQYLTLLAFDDELAVTQRTLETAQAAYKLAQLQFQTGVGSELDLREAQTVVEQAQANHAAQARARAQAENALVLLLGQPVPEELPPPMGLSDQRILADVPAGLPSDLLTRRPDIAQAEDALRGYNANIGAARAAFFPRIVLTGEYGTASSSLGGLFKPGSDVWNWGPSLSIPIFTAGANAANLNLAYVQRDIAVAQYEKAIQAAFREVADGLAARGTYDQQLASLQRYAEAQQRRLELSQIRYKHGVDSYLSVLTAQTALYDAQLAVVATRLQRFISLVDLYRDLGGGWIARTGETPRPADAPPS